MKGNIFAIALDPQDVPGANPVILFRDVGRGHTTKVAIPIPGDIDAIAMDETSGEYAAEVTRVIGYDRKLVSGNWRTGIQRGNTSLPAGPWFSLTSDPQLAILGGAERTLKILDLRANPAKVIVNLASPPMKVASQKNETSPWLYALLWKAGRLRVTGATSMVLQTQSDNEITIEERDGTV